jgi:hypothetical protein
MSREWETTAMVDEWRRNGEELRTLGVAQVDAVVYWIGA